jgi:hypothetical protein
LRAADRHTVNPPSPGTVGGAVGADEEPDPATCIWLPAAPLDVDDGDDVD